MPADSVHASSIDCLVSLGITTGTSATTFSPDRTVTGVQTSLFLMRLIEWRTPTQGDVCPTSSASSFAALRERARRCLVEMRVINPDDPLDSPMTRSQMAVYLVGFARAWSGGGPTPVPPAVGVPAVTGPFIDTSRHFYYDDIYQTDIRPDLPSRITIPVVVCAPAGVYSEQGLAYVVDRLNEAYAPHFAWQSSGMLEVAFASGGIVTPDAPWDEVWPDVPYGELNWLVMPPECAELGWERTGTTRFATLLYNGPTRRDTGWAWGRAWLGSGGGVTYFTDYVGDSDWYYNYWLARGGLPDHELRVRIIIHELHHALLAIGHPFGSTSMTYDERLFLPLRETIGTFGAGRRTRFVGDPGELDHGLSRVFSCPDRERLGWPTGPGTPACALVCDVDGDLLKEVDITFARTARGGTMTLGAGRYDRHYHLAEVTTRRIGPNSYESTSTPVHGVTIDKESSTRSVLSLESGKLYSLTVIPFTEDCPGAGVQVNVVAMVMPDEVSITRIRPGPGFDVRWPAMANVTEYRIHGTLSGQYLWLHGSGAGSGSGYRYVQGNSTWLTEVDGIKYNTPVDLRIDACFATSCAPYARVTLPAVPSPDDPFPECEATDSDDPLSSPRNLQVVEVFDDDALLQWDHVPCANYYIISAPVGEPSAGNTISAVQFRESSNISSVGHLLPNTVYTVEVRGCITELDDSGEPKTWEFYRCSAAATVQFTTTGS